MNTKEIKTEFNNFLKTEEGRSWQKEKADSLKKERTARRDRLFCVISFVYFGI